VKPRAYVCPCECTRLYKAGVLRGEYPERRHDRWCGVVINYVHVQPTGISSRSRVVPAASQLSPRRLNYSRTSVGFDPPVSIRERRRVRSFGHRNPLIGVLGGPRGAGGESARRRRRWSKELSSSRRRHARSTSGGHEWPVVGRYVHLLWCCTGTVCAVGRSRESLVMYICVVQCIAQSVSQPR